MVQENLYLDSEADFSVLEEIKKMIQKEHNLCYLVMVKFPSKTKLALRRDGYLYKPLNFFTLSTGRPIRLIMRDFNQAQIELADQMVQEDYK